MLNIIYQIKKDKKIEDWEIYDKAMNKYVSQYFKRTEKNISVEEVENEIIERMNEKDIRNNVKKTVKKDKI